MIYESGDKFKGLYYVRNSSAQRLAIDIVHPDGRTGYVLARVEGDTLTYCGSDDPLARPAEFVAREGDGRFFFILRRRNTPTSSKRVRVPDRKPIFW